MWMKCWWIKSIQTERKRFQPFSEIISFIRWMNSFGGLSMSSNSEVQSISNHTRPTCHCSHIYYGMWFHWVWFLSQQLFSVFITSSNGFVWERRMPKMLIRKTSNLQTKWRNIEIPRGYNCWNFTRNVKMNIQKMLISNKITISKTVSLVVILRESFEFPSLMIPFFTFSTLIYSCKWVSNHTIAGVYSYSQMVEYLVLATLFVHLISR